MDINWLDPDGEDSFPIDWQYDLPSGETISTATWSAVTTELSIVSSTRTSTSTSVQVAAETSDITTKATCRITTSGGKVRDRTLYFIVRDQ